MEKLSTTAFRKLADLNEKNKDLKLFEVTFYDDLLYNHLKVHSLTIYARYLAEAQEEIKRLFPNEKILILIRK